MKSTADHYKRLAAAAGFGASKKTVPASKLLDVKAKKS